MKNRDSDPLLDGILGGEQLEDLRQASLAFGLEVLRRRRRRRRIVHTCALVGLPLIGILTALMCQDITSRRRHSISSAPAPIVAGAAGTNHEVEFINDEQLFALFPNRAMALVGKPGHQQLVFLDQPKPAEPEIRQ